MKQNFVSTADPKTAEKLRALGFKELPNGNNKIFTFLNDSRLNFSEGVEINKIKYSNMLTF